MKEKIDILLATYNGEKYLKEQIDSILNQTYSDIRLIISDDCSKDNTRQILNEYRNKDSRIELYFQEENLGYIRNFEFLLTKVENDIYMLSDQDDFWLEEKVEKTLETLKKEKADLVFGDLEVVDENLNTIYPSFNDYMLLTRKINKYINTNNEYKIEYLYNCITGCTLMGKKKHIKYIMPIPPKSKYLIHDHWIGIIVAMNGKMAYMPEKYIKYRQHGKNQVGTDKISHEFTKLKQVRDLFLKVKLGIFGTYVENEKRFPQNIRTLNKKAYEYFKMLEKKKNFNFKGWSIFHELYKTESFKYYIQNFMILNMPFISKGAFAVRLAILKVLGKR